MSTRYSTAVSLTGSSVHLSPARCQSRRLSIATQPSRRRQIGSDGGLNAAAFERFLYWLGPDPEAAGQKYESIRGRLIMMFSARRCVFAEDLADATFERVVRKMTDLTTEFSGDPARYFYGVAKNIYLEYQRRIIADQRRAKFSIPTKIDNPDLENMLKQLDEALSVIPESDRELILTYYTGSGKNKINHRRALAEQFGLQPSALRLRVFRIRRELKSYILRSNQTVSSCPIGT
jgi:RNA polymerase sigma factor (sigma-70 family)